MDSAHLIDNQVFSYAQLEYLTVGHCEQIGVEAVVQGVQGHMMLALLLEKIELIVDQLGQ